MIGQHRQLNRSVTMSEAALIATQSEIFIASYEPKEGIQPEAKKAVLDYSYTMQNLASALMREMEMNKDAKATPTKRGRKRAADREAQAPVRAS